MFEGVTVVGAWKIGVDVVQTIVLVCVGIYAWVLRKTDRNQEAIKAIEKENKEVQKSLIQIKQTLSQIPDASLLHSRVTEVSERVSEVKGKVTAMSKQLELISQTLLRQTR